MIEMTEDSDIIEKLLKDMEDASYADMIAEVNKRGLTMPKLASDAWIAGYSTGVADIFKLRAYIDARESESGSTELDEHQQGCDCIDCFIERVYM